MRTQVVIIWDKPENKYWLTAENIRKALSDYYLGATNFEVEELKNIHGECGPLEAIEIDNNNNKNILVEFADEQLKLISEKELEEIEQSAEEFDGFTGMRVVGRLGKLVNETLAETVYEIRNNIGHSWYSVGQQIPDLKVAKRILNEWRENGDDSFALFKVTKEKIDC